MADIVDKVTRSRMMSGIRGKDTKPEKVVRSFLYRAGLRFRLHVGTLPGKPDIVLPKYQTVVMVNGCFWHRHKGCRYAYAPKSRKSFWAEKFSRNVERDVRNARLLRGLGWQVLVVWECQTNDERLADLVTKIVR